MARPQGEKASFFDILTSPLILIPLVAGVGLGLASWGLEWDEQFPLPFGWPLSVVAGTAGIGLAVLVFFVKLINRGSGGSKMSSKAQQARDDLLENLESLGRGLQRRGAQESTTAGTIAPVEK